MPRNSIVAFSVLLAALVVAQPALAHHAVGGGQTLDFELAFVSGLAHPVINVEHFAFVIAIGIAAAVAQGSRWLPVWFVGGTVLGCVIAVAGYEIPYAYWIMLLALVAFGAALVWGRQRIGYIDLAVFFVTGILHGSVYAESIIGNVTSSIAGYLAGFAIIQTVIAMGAMMVAYALWRGDRLYENARVVGGVVTGVGLTVLAQGIVQTLLPLT